MGKFRRGQGTETGKTSLSINWDKDIRQEGVYSRKPKERGGNAVEFVSHLKGHPKTLKKKEKNSCQTSIQSKSRKEK